MIICSILFIKLNNLRTYYNFCYFIRLIIVHVHEIHTREIIIHENWICTRMRLFGITRSYASCPVFVWNTCSHFIGYFFEWSFLHGYDIWYRIINHNL